MKCCLFDCGENCEEGLDWLCKECGTRYHDMCIPVDKRARWEDKYINVCLQCKRPFDDVTVGCWVASTYNDSPKAGIFDVNYIRKGFVIAVQPYKYLGEKNWIRHVAFISVGEHDSEDERKYAKDNWFMITRKLDSSPFFKFI